MNQLGTRNLLTPTFPDVNHSPDPKHLEISCSERLSFAQDSWSRTGLWAVLRADIDDEYHLSCLGEIHILETPQSQPIACRPKCAPKIHYKGARARRPPRGFIIICIISPGPQRDRGDLYAEKRAVWRAAHTHFELHGQVAARERDVAPEGIKFSPS